MSTFDYFIYKAQLTAGMGGLVHLCMAALAISALSAGVTHSAWAENTNVGMFGTGSALWPDCVDAAQCYLPGEVVISPGDQVTWINKDGAAHTVTGGSAISGGPNRTTDSGAVHAGETFSHTFEETGEYPYFCMIHPWMSGKVTVIDGTDRGFDALYAPAGLDVYTYRSGAFAFVTGPQNTLSVINITDTTNPVLAATVRNDAAFDSPRGPFDVEVYSASDTTYAMVTNGDRGHASIINVTNPYLPVPIQTAWQDMHDSELPEQITDIEIFSKADDTYALMGKFYTDEVQIVNITDPKAPNIVALLQNGQYGIDAIVHPNDIEVYETADKIYAVISGHHNTLQMVDVTDPHAPKGIAGLGNVQGADDEQYGWHVAVWAKSDMVYGMVSNYYNNTVKIIGITDPQMPHTIQDIQSGFDALWRPGEIEIYTDAQKTYAIILGGTVDSGSLQIIDVSDPRMPASVSMILDQENASLESPRGMELLEWNDNVYVIVASAASNAIQVIDITESDSPEIVSSIQNRAAPDA